MIDLYYWPTPNGHKITMFLEEAGLDYTIYPVDISAGDQFKPDFLAISPNNRMPAIIDTAPADGGEQCPLLRATRRGTGLVGGVVEFLVQFQQPRRLLRIREPEPAPAFEEPKRPPIVRVGDREVLRYEVAVDARRLPLTGVGPTAQRTHRAVQSRARAHSARSCGY